MSPLPGLLCVCRQACKYSDGKWEAALQVLDVMEARGLQSVAAYNEAMAVCGAAKRSKQVVQILDRMAKVRGGRRGQTHRQARTQAGRRADRSWLWGW